MRSQSPDLVLLDICLPAGDGFALSKKFKLSPAPTPIIFITASNAAPASAKKQRTGSGGIFEKPYESEELLATIPERPQPTQPFVTPAPGHGL